MKTVDSATTVMSASHADSFRIDKSMDPGAAVTICGLGAEIARYDVKHGWIIQVEGKEVSLEKLIRQLNFLQATLQSLLPETQR